MFAQITKTPAILYLSLLASVAMLNPASSHPPAELADYVGARAGQAEGGLARLGYVNVKGSYWFNSGEGVCVHMPISQGRFKSIDIVKPSSCGVNITTDHGPGAGCPADVSQADRYLYPDCDKPAAGGGNGVPRAAIRACMRSADEYQGVAPGTSKSVGSRRVDGDWVLKMSSGSTYKSTCTVTSGGDVIEMSPGY